MTMPALPADGNTSWGNGGWAAEVDNRVRNAGTATSLSVRTIGAGATEAAAGNHSHAAASETVAGLVELADGTETPAGTDATRAVSPFRLAAELAKKANALVTTTTVSTTTYTLTLADFGTDIEFTNASGCAVTIPLNSSVAAPVGSITTFWQRGASQVTVGGPGAGAAGGTAGGVTVESRGSVFKTAGLNAAMTLKKRATDGHLVTGDISS